MFDETWVEHGRHGGLLIRKAESHIEAIRRASWLSITVLNAQYGNEHLAESMQVQSFIEDMKMARFGAEWAEEREAIATGQSGDFRESWPSMRTQLLENYVVSIVGALENYVKSILVEFPGIYLNDSWELGGRADALEDAWKKADNSYRRALKKNLSTFKAWNMLCNESGIPKASKSRVSDWAQEKDAKAVDILVLMRNSLTHQAGLVNNPLAEILGMPPGTRLLVEGAVVRRFERSFYGFLTAVEQAL